MGASPPVNDLRLAGNDYDTRKWLYKASLKEGRRKCFLPEVLLDLRNRDLQLVCLFFDRREIVFV